MFQGTPDVWYSLLNSVASEHPVSGPGVGGEVEANGEGTLQWQHCPETP